MKKQIIIALAFLFIFNLSFANFSKQQYVEMWSGTAILEMVNYKVPASITIAQGILESGCGNSDLAKNGNNHFGIKCHEWTGEKMYVDDDSKGECFRVYAKAEESFADHSLFLTGRSRYSKLFTYDIMDYKSWAKGLKEAGYATNPKYPDLLIGIIEDLKLYELDQIGVPNNLRPPVLAEVKESVNKEQKTITTSTVVQEKGDNKSSGTVKTTSTKKKEIDLENKNALSNTHQVMEHTNVVKYIIARKGDTYFRIAEEFQLTIGQLYKYNDFSENKDVLEEGDVIYLQPKRLRSKSDKSEFKLERSMTLTEISQMLAIKISALQKLNSIENAGDVIAKGTKIKIK